MLSGGKIGGSMELFDLKWTAGTAEQNRAFAALGKYVQGLMEVEEKSEETAKKFSIQYDADGMPYVNVDVDQEQFDGLNIKEKIDKARDVLRE